MKKGYQLQMFRAMQLAIKGALMSADFDILVLEGIDRIQIGMDTYIDEIPLDGDFVTIDVYGTSSQIDLKHLSDAIIDDIINTMLVKSLEMANKDVIVSGNIF